MLRLVHPGDGGNLPTRRRKGLRPSTLSFTADEARNVRAAIRGAARTLGGLTKLAAAIGVCPRSLYGKRCPGPAVALAIARAAGLSLDAMIAGKITDAGKCHACGAKRGAS